VPTGELEIQIAPAIALEPIGGVVGCKSVRLGDEAMRRPVEVDLMTGDEAVDERFRQAAS
jgi:hypothetical protein